VRIRFIGVLAFAALFLTACAGGAGSSIRPTSPASTHAGISTPGASMASSGNVTIEVATSDLGDILVGEGGMTLYAFTPDEGQETPTCNDACAATWPPVTGEATAGSGVDESLLSTATRADGTTQVVYGDYPLYYFSGDTAAGDTNGQGLNGKWFVVGADGELIGENAEPSM
jgi:predicted lipoprotein with Yx(FWY)xxD motif